MKRGQRLPLSIENTKEKIKVGVRYTPDPFEKFNMDVDFVARTNNKVFWYGSNAENDNELSVFVDSQNCLGGFAGDDDDRIIIDPTKLTDNDKVEIFLSIFHPNGKDLSSLEKVELKIYSDTGTYLEETIEFSQDIFKEQTTILIGEIYNYKGGWRFRYLEGLYKVNHFKEVM